MKTSDMEFLCEVLAELGLGRAPRGFREPPRRASDRRPGDLARVESALADGVRLYAAVARRRKEGPQCPDFILSEQTGCFTRSRVGAVTPDELAGLMRKHGFSTSWWIPDQPVILSRAVWERLRHEGLHYRQTR